MNHRRRSSLRRQQGMSLISLMVGLVLSLICAVAALHAYRATVLNSRAAAVASRAHNVSASLSLQVGKLLSQAGYGMNGTDTNPGGKVDTDLVLLANASLTNGRLSGTPTPISTTSQTGTALVWSTALGGTTNCYALVAGRGVGMQLLGPQACANAAAATSATWADKTPLVSAEVFPDMSFQAVVADCWPFGGSDLRHSVNVTVLGARSALPATCVLNIQS